MIHTLVGDLGHLFVITAFVSSLYAAFSFVKATGQIDLASKERWLQNGRFTFYLHSLSVVGIIICLFYIIYNHYFEYHYAWDHSSRRLPTHYMISCFWEGQEGSFLLWLFWHAVLGIILMRTNRYWEAPVMSVFAMVQAFLASMILGVVIPGLQLKIGSSPFILLRDALDAPIFKSQPNFVPKDGTGLNALLQNYWMVIHPPTLFLGFATTLVPFSFCIAGLWKKKYTEWIRPALPWALFSGAVLGLGILMGGYWAYETLNFGGYWNWDPVENAVYVPWLVLVASIHTMITFKNSNTALKTSIILVIATFLLILYSTFLVRSGVLGEASVHSFTDLGLSGQLVAYLLFFVIMAIAFCAVRWKEIPSSEKEMSTYSRELWIFIGATTLCLMGFQVLVPTSIPLYNTIIRGLEQWPVLATVFDTVGITSNIAIPADQMAFYSKFQVWFALAVALLSGTGQFFWWKKMDGSRLFNELSVPLILTLIISGIGIAVYKIDKIPYLVLLTAGVYSLISNGKVLLKLMKSSPKLSGGAVAHIGIAMMLIGILFSSGYSKVVSLNQSGQLISRSFSTQFNSENLFLSLGQTKKMAGYDIVYKGDKVEDRKYGAFIDKYDLALTDVDYLRTAKTDIIIQGDTLFRAKDTVDIFEENTYYEIEYTKDNGKSFRLYPRAQVNERMGGLLASPDIRRGLARDLYTHVSSIPNPETNEEEWSELEQLEVKKGAEFFANDYVAVIEGFQQMEADDEFPLNQGDIGIRANIVVKGKGRDYIARPGFVIRNQSEIARISDEIGPLGIRLTLMEIKPQTESFVIGINTTQQPWIVLKAMEKPMINVLWIGTLVLMLGFGIAINRRYAEFRKMRDRK